MKATIAATPLSLRALALALAALSTTACAAEAGSDGASSSESELFFRAPTAPPPPSTLVTTFDAWKERCGVTGAPVGVVVPRSSWSCPTVQSGQGAFVGQDGREYIAKGHELGLDDATLLARTPDLTPAMIAKQQPFCAYVYLKGDGALSVTQCASRIYSLESAVGPIAGPLCVSLSDPRPGSTSCPSCWGTFVIAPDLVFPYP